MELFDNVTRIVRDDLTETIKPQSRLSIAAACFSIYAYKELKKQLSSIDECRFIFTSPTFVTDKSEKEQKEFYIPRLSRERSLYGTEFEVKLRNELNQRAIARECADWIRRKATFKSNNTQEAMQGFLNVDQGEQILTYMPLNGFTTVDIGCDRGRNVYNMVNKFDAPFSTEYMKLFERVWSDDTRMQDVTEEVIDSISAVYEENPPELVYFLTLYQIFHEFLADLSEDDLPKEKTGFRDSVIWKKLYAFQKDAALGIINKLEKYNGCILADSVGLGKTFTALAVVKYYECRNGRVLVLCPKKLKDNWLTYRGNLKNNPLEKDRLRYDVVFHTDLSRDRGETVTGMKIEQISWDNYDLVVIDESHNFRNGGEYSGEDNEKENRYLRLMNRIIKGGVPTKVLMLSATPVNNRFNDLRNQLALAYEGQPEQINQKLNTTKDIDTIFREAQKAFNAWSKLPPEEQTTAALQQELDYDFFELLDSVTIARSRKQIHRYYDTTEIGSFPVRKKPISVSPKLTDLRDAVNYAEIFEQLNLLNLKVYMPTEYIQASKLLKYIDPNDKRGLSQSGRELGIVRLMRTNLLKRMESSVGSFRMTVERIADTIKATIQRIDDFEAGIGGNTIQETQDLSQADFDLDDQNTDFFHIGRKIRIDMRDMNFLSWRREMEADLVVLQNLLDMVAPITPEHDSKLSMLKEIIARKQQNPINPGNKKILIFTAFADTAEYLYQSISRYALQEFGIHSALITGTIDGRTTIPRFPVDMNSILTCFSPISKDRELVLSDLRHHNIDILIATDCISEGQNLQDCDYCINYDIHWNPVRIIQRFGRVDRIGSRNQYIQLVNFWPDIELDEYIKLKARVETRMRISVMTSTGDDDYLNTSENGDLTYRRQQLQRLKEEVVDLEEMNSGISIMDLGLNDFRMDLLAYIKENPGIDKTPFGIHAVVHGDKPGVIFVLKNVNKGIDIKNQNYLHPFYMVYVGDDGEIICNHLQPKDTLDRMRHASRGKNVPDLKACHVFNAETKDGRDMRRVSQLLQDAIASIISKKEESDIDSFFGGGQTSFLSGNVSGLDDFELICFMVVVS